MKVILGILDMLFVTRFHIILGIFSVDRKNSFTVIYSICNNCILETV